MYKIAISGKAGAGKDTLCKFLLNEIERVNCEHNKPMYEHMVSAFADPIKEIILLMYPFLNKEYLYGDSKYRNEVISGSFKDGKPLTIRQLLRDIGEEYKKYNPNVWVDSFDYRWKDFIRVSNPRNVNAIFCTDLRFTVEYNYLKRNNFYLIRLKKNNIKNDNSHISETQQDELLDSSFDKIVLNDGDLFDLKNKAVEIIDQIYKP